MASVLDRIESWMATPKPAAEAPQMTRAIVRPGDLDAVEEERLRIERIERLTQMFAMPAPDQVFIERMNREARMINEVLGMPDSTVGTPEAFPMPATPPRAAVTADPAFDDEYLKVATELGIVSSPAVLRARLEKFFADEFIEVYDTNKVAEYMNRLAEKETFERFGLPRSATASRFGGRVIWGWAGLRPVDTAAHAQDVRFHGCFLGKTYAQKVPLPALLTAKKIADVFGLQVNFYVSDYEAVKPDPFLMVCGQGTPFYVVERWDEPAFRP